MHRRGVNLVEGPVGKHLLNLGTFMALGVVFIMIMSLVDIYYVSRLGHHELAAISFTFPVLMIVSAVTVGLGNGMISVIARAVGKGDRGDLRTLATDGLLLGCLLMLVMAVVGYATIDPIFTLMGASPDVMPYIKGYMHIWYLSVGIQVIPVLASSVFRSLGDMRTPTLMYATMCILLLVIDPLLIFGWGPVPRFGIEGAAYANAIVRTVGMVFVLFMLHYRFQALAPISLSWSRLRESWGKLLYVGLPSMSAQLATPISAALVTKIVALSGIAAVAAFGVASRIESVTSIYLWGVAGALPAFVGQNAGAGRMDRVREAVSLSVKFCIGAGLCLVLAALIGGAPVVSNFSDNPEVKSLAVFYLRAVSVGYGLTGLVLISSQTMNALHRPLPAAAINLARTVGVTLPFAVIGHYLGQVHGVFIAIAVAGATCGAGAWLTMRSVVDQETQRQVV